MATSTGLSIIQSTLSEVGLPSPTSLVGTTDNAALQCLAILNGLGQELIEGDDWQVMMSSQQFTGDGVAQDFPLPADFSRHISQTGWDNTNHWEMRGPATPSQWNWLTKGIISTGPRVWYRIIGNNIRVFPIPGAGQVFTIEYIKQNWVQDANSPTTYKNSITKDGDIPVFNFRMLIAGLKTKFWGIKGFDTSGLESEYLSLKDLAIANQSPSPSLSLAPQAANLLIGVQNLPETGYGS